MIGWGAVDVDVCDRVELDDRCVVVSIARYRCNTS